MVVAFVHTGMDQCSGMTPEHGRTPLVRLRGFPVARSVGGAVGSTP
jgi:hypothetical protein